MRQLSAVGGKSIVGYRGIAVSDSTISFQKVFQYRIGNLSIMFGTGEFYIKIKGDSILEGESVAKFVVKWLGIKGAVALKISV